jgi:transposase-like protein
MDTHKNARLTPKGREQMVHCVVDGGLSSAATARKYNTTPKTVAKWVKRFRAEGVDGLRDRSSRPLSSDSQTPQATCVAVEALRRQRYTGNQIARELGISPATVSRILRRRGLNKLSALEPAEPVRRYEREKAGELIHLDIKKLGRIGSVGHRITGRQSGVVNRHLGIGWEFVHVCIDDASRVAFVQIMANQRKESAVAFLQAAVAYYAKLGVRIECVMTDNGSCYRSKTFRTACTRLGLRQIFTRPYTEVDPVSWTPEHLCSRSPRWRRRDHLTVLSSVGRAGARRPLAGGTGTGVRTNGAVDQELGWAG